MRLIHPFLHFISVSLLILMTSCRDDDVKCYEPTNPDCENYDPCHDHKPADASFDIFEVVGVWRQKEYVLSETDTILQFNGALFRQSSVNKNQKFTWIVGAENIQDQEEVYRNGFPVGWIEITLIAAMDSHTCLNVSELHDTVTRRFYVMQNPGIDSNKLRELPWWGTWEGYNTDAPDDRFNITFGWISESGWSEMSPAGLPKGLNQKPFYSHSTSRCPGVTYYYGYKVYVFLNKSGHQDWAAFALNGIVKRNGSIEVEYSYNNTPYQRWLKGESHEPEPVVWVKKKFVGQKISNQVLNQ